MELQGEGQGAGQTGRITALFLGALALRPELIAIGPLLPLIQADLGVPHYLAGLLSTIPLACMGLFALPAPAASQRFGTRLAMTLCLGAIAILGVGRAIAPGTEAILLLTIPVGVAMGIGGALLPIAVKERFNGQPAFGTGIYTNGLQLGSAVAGAIAVPIALALGGWRASLLVISIAIGALTVGWHYFTRRDPAHTLTIRHAVRPQWPLRDPIVWTLVATFALRATVFQGLVAWLPAVYVERGWQPADAGLLSVALIVSGLPVTWLVSRAADRRGSRRQYLGAAASGLLVATLGLVLAPAFGYGWAVLTGASLGVLLPLTLTLPLDVAARPQDVGRIASMMLAGGYLVSAASPVGLGAVRDLTGDFSGSLAVLSIVATVLLAATLFLSPERLATGRKRLPA